MDGSVDPSANYSQLFDVQPLTRVIQDTYITQGGLNMVHDVTYRVFVMAVDVSGGCVDTSGVVTVDTTPPKTGHIGVGPPTALVR